MEIKKILVPFDHNLRSIHALEFAGMLAASFGATVTALHLADPKQFHSKTQFKKELDLMVSKQLRPTLREIRKSYPEVKKLDLQVRGLEGPLYRHILDFARKEEVDFIVMRHHGQPESGHWEPFLMDTTAYKVVLDAPCPVFTFTEPPTGDKLQNILLPLDLSEGSLYKVPLAMAIARQFKARLHLISASEHGEDHAELSKQLEEAKEELVAQGFDLEVLPVAHRPLADSILQYSRERKADLVVIMSRPGFKWSDLWVSPKAKKIIGQSPIPVLSVRTNHPTESDV